MEEAQADVRFGLQAVLEHILARPTPEDLWQLQQMLLALGGETALQVREVAGEFHSYLRDLESKVRSRRASRWGAFLETASVTSVSLQEMLVEDEEPLRRILNSGVTAALELAAAAQNVRAWEVEASSVHYDVAWYLYGELWDISVAAQPELPWQERRAHLGVLMQPLLDEKVPGEAKSALLVKLFQVVLVARALPLFWGNVSMS